MWLLSGLLRQRWMSWCMSPAECSSPGSVTRAGPHLYPHLARSHTVLHLPGSWGLSLAGTCLVCPIPEPGDGRVNLSHHPGPARLWDRLGLAFTSEAALPSQAAVLLIDVFAMKSFFSGSEELYELIFTSLYFKFTWSMVVFPPAPQQVDGSSQKFLRA